MILWQMPLSTGWGVFTAGFSDRGLAFLSFPGTAPAVPDARNRTVAGLRSAGKVSAELSRWQRRAQEALGALLSSGAFRGPLPPLAPEPSGTDFQRAVWAALSGIRPGDVLTYGELARRLGRPGAARAVGQACGANPLPVFIPCHRVVAADGGLGGFSAGLDWKRRLLDAEAIAR